MTIRLLSSIDTAAIDDSAHICVVGAGFAGLFAACRLAETGYKVAVLESGLRTFDQAIHGLNEIDDVLGTYKGALDGRFRGLGGTSSRWGGRMLPLTSHDAQERAYASLDAWPFDIKELDVYRPEIEQFFGIDHASFEEDALDFLDRRGVIPRGDPHIALRYPKWPTFRRCNLAIAMHDRIEATANLDIWLGATVCGYELDRASGRLTKLIASDLSGRTVHMTADEFIFAAGTIETTRLLLSLDAASDQRAFAECRVLGRYFRDHLACSVGNLTPADRKRTNFWFGYHLANGTRRNLYMELTPESQKADRVSSAHAQVHIDPSDQSALNIIKKFLRGLQRREQDLSLKDGLRLATDPASLFRTAYWRYVHRQLFLPSDLGLILSISVEQAPDVANRITLSDRTDRLGCRLARLEWRPGEADARTIRACAAKVRSYWKRAGLDQICPITWNASILEETGALLENVEDLYHPAGSTRMGTTSAESVVGPDLRCHHVANLSVASASTFPSTGSANPTFTIIQIAMRAADAVARRLAGP